MSSDHAEKQAPPGQDGRSPRFPLLSGITARFLQYPSAGRQYAFQADPEHVTAVLCITGRLQVQFTGRRRAQAAGPGELLLVTGAAQAQSLTPELAPASLLSADVDLQTLDGQLPPDFMPDRKRLQAQIDACGGCLALRDPDWGQSVLAALRRLPSARYAPYFSLRLLERLYLLESEGSPDSAWAQSCYCDLYQKETIVRVHDYILSTLDEPSTIQQLARTFQLSPTYLKERFRQIYGLPIHTYLRQYRLQKAAHLLCTTSERVLTIASQVGYSGTSRFNTAFKEMYHVTPTQYRRLYREKLSKTED